MFTGNIDLEYTRAEKVILAISGTIPIVVLTEAVLSGQIDIPMQPTATDPVSILIWMVGLLLLAIGAVFTLAWRHVTGESKSNHNEIREDIKDFKVTVLDKLDQIENEIIRKK